ncbi:signal recognition particle protein Sec65 [Cordyceps fumosorosea ARSEF 2679]|uniref:Signal recognition particle protein Sec65 n=1 Tax=Cordyceps fumosorosea (strain ARSEF 2679) TaxID=1081104 RepID=A0A167SBG0_CORFA|nr:signal recognition particle protein Sec65 [Cordyceps fumosorosea ARSEF 2679]OAA59452.1 signal recognition particle protein Sec65 [Cordyceps fumosorosea ARSEF 2679]
MAHPRIEDVSDSDPDMVSDPEDFDIDDFDDTNIMQRVEPKAASAAAPPPSSSSSSAAAATAAQQAMQQMMLNSNNMRAVTADERASYAGYQSLYPVYFDAERSRAQGRRVAAALAVRSPLARDIADACSRLRLQAVLEPDKTHPKDWANPGRVKVALKPNAGNDRIANKHHLYLLVAQHLRENPTTERSAGLRVRMGGQIHPPEDKPYPKPAAPRGWRINEYLPYMSAAMTGGGVSENLFKDIMKEMQGGGDPMAALMAGAGQAGGPSASASDDGGKKKKDKKKGRA